MKLYTSKQIKEWDAYTIAAEGISSFQLMQRAAKACFEWIKERYSAELPVVVLCGPGNNGGDGLLIAAYLFQLGYQVEVYAMEGAGSEDRIQALEYAAKHHVPIHTLTAYRSASKSLIIDALFGHGMSRPLEGDLAELIQGINHADSAVISIDIPSGMPSEPQATVFSTCIHAAYVLSFQQAKQGFFLDEYGASIGFVQILDIGLSPNFSNELAPVLIDEGIIQSLFIPKERFSHKGTFGNALLIGGSEQYPGAISLSTLACLASGAGKTFVATPDKSAESCKILAPEAIYIPNCGEKNLQFEHDLSAYDAVGIGPGLGMDEVVQAHVIALLNQKQHWVIDADALNTLALHPNRLPQGEVVITPHPGEFDRLTSKHASTGARWKKAGELSRDKQWIVVLKGAYTSVFFPDGRQFINNRGNSGLAKGGSGDVLCGLMTGLIARGYSVEHGVLIAVYLHGLAADRLNEYKSKDAIKAMDLISVIEAICKQWED